jgi:hypothetical protein
VDHWEDHEVGARSWEVLEVGHVQHLAISVIK